MAISALRPAVLVLLALALACSREAAPPAPPAATPSAATAEPDAAGATPATATTIAAQAAVASALPLADAQDFEDASRGLLASDPDLVVRAPSGPPIWDLPAYDFVTGEAPPTVNPSLWRQAKLNGQHGLFRVTEGVHQLRGYDISNLTIIDGATGWIVVDPLTTQETAAAALAFARQHLRPRPIVAVVFTHSHVDHFGGIAAVLPDEAAAAGVRVIAPAGFVEEATSENVLAGVAMGRRATYMFGTDLPRSPRGHVDTGLGKGPARGTMGLRLPTETIDHTGQELVIDGVRFVFQYAPHSEAPAELTFYLPEKQAWCAAEIATHTLHNLYTLRGAKVRDALLWSGYIDEAMRRWPDAEVVFASHHWPVWGKERIHDFLAKQRDVYKYIHDQTLRLANAGLGPEEIAEQLELPEALRTAFAVRGYYGTVSHDAKAVYQNYFGWFDGNPAHLDPLPPAEAARRYVEFMGGAAEVKRKARESFERGEYRWVAMVMHHAVFADPDDAEARELLARAYDQLGYQAESGPWRDVYLSGAHELRHGITTPPLATASLMGLLRHLPLKRFFDAMAVRVVGPKAAGRELTLNFVFTDLGETHVVELSNGVLHHHEAEADPGADVTVRLTREFLLRLSTGQAGLREMIFSDDLHVEGSRTALLGFFSLLDRPDGRFPIVTP
ncbi:MAG: MBL fold metallo-hydrolase [Deltaproteobacteria bacterium]|nr:MBL fold metallo-hydrolase [Deltaproteobacteria bacterium]